MADVTVPTAPALATIPGVELVQVGQWELSSGTAVITREDLAAAVGALDCPAIRNPILKLGHIDPRFDGEPAVGWVGNMLLTDDGNTIVGDYRGMPGWLAAADANGDRVITSAYPDRSIEATRDFVCQIGHTHQMVITAVALLGVAQPGIGTLDSLQDVATLYDLAASAGGEPITITIKGAAMPNPGPPAGPVEVAAGVTTEDVRRAYYDRQGYTYWICEMQLEPELQLIVTDDRGAYHRVPVTIDGDEATFADPVEVAVEYVDKKVAAGAPARPASIVWASRSESAPEDAPADPPPAEGTTQTPVATPASGPIKNDLEDLDMEFSDEQLAALRAKLGLPEDAALDPAALVQGIEKLAASGGDGSPGKTTKNAPGTVTVDQQVWDDMQTRISGLEQIRASQQRTDRERAVDDAIKAGKFAPSRRDHWLRVYEADPEGTAQLLAGLTPGQVPVDDFGMPGVGDGPDIDAEFAGLFPPERKA